MTFKGKIICFIYTLIALLPKIHVICSFVHRVKFLFIPGMHAYYLTLQRVINLVLVNNDQQLSTMLYPEQKLKESL